MPSAVRSLLERLLPLGPGQAGRDRPVDGGGLVTPVGTGGAEVLEDAAPPQAAAPRLRRDPARLLHEATASQVLHAWLQNRQQTLFPLTLNLRLAGPEQRALLVRLAAASAALCLDEAAADAGRRLHAALAPAGAGEEERRALEAELAAPSPLPPLLEAIREAGLGAHAYATALAALGEERGGPAGRAWLDLLAARFALPAELAGSLRRRAAVGGRRRRLAERRG
jgi:hypothetical protein